MINGNKKEVKAGESVTFTVNVDSRYIITDCDGAILIGDKLIIENVLYNRTISLILKKTNPDDIILQLSSGTGKSYKDMLPIIVEDKKKVRLPIAYDYFYKDGYLLNGYTTQIDGEKVYDVGETIAINSSTTLYAYYEKETTPDFFSIVEENGYNKIMGFSAEAQGLYIDKIVFPPFATNGKPITHIAPYAFSDNTLLRTVVFGPNIVNIDESAFSNCTSIEQITLTESLVTANNCWKGLSKPIKVNINRTSEVYISDGSYPGAFIDKWRLLKETSGKRLIIVAGSSSAFGIDSEMLHHAFSNYTPINLGLHAEIGVLQYFSLLRHYAREGDIIVLARELDSDTFTNDYINYDYIEKDYAAIQDLVPFSGERTLQLLISLFNKKQNFIATNSSYWNGYRGWNQYGDVTMVRPHGEAYNPTRIKAEEFLGDEKIGPLLQFYDDMQSKGVRVYMSFPMFYGTHSDDAEYDAVQELADKLPIPTISKIKDYVQYSKDLFYDTCYHLTLEGRQNRTLIFINDLNNKMREDNLL